MDIIRPSIGVGKKLPVFITEAVVKLAENGKNASYIVWKLKQDYNFVTTRQSVYNITKVCQRQDHVKKSGTCIHNKKILDIHKKVIDQELQENPELTSQGIKTMLKRDFGIDISRQHISRIRRELGWTSKRTKYCQLISTKNKLFRLNWCLEALLIKEKFENVIFTDETSIEMTSSGRFFFYRKKSEMDRLPGKAPKPKHPYKVQMWAGISYRGRTPCCIFSGIMDSTIYQEILNSNLLPFTRKKFRDGFRLYQDNDSKHVSKSTKEWMQRNGIIDSVMVTPASSPDLNPIENVWAALKEHLQRQVKPKTKEELVSGIVVWCNS